MFPSESISIFSAAGFLGSPGIVIIFPVIATINSAPAFILISFTCILNGSLHSKFFGSSENEYCVFAIHTGYLENPSFSIFSISSRASLEYSTPSAPYILQATFSIFSFIVSSS